MHEHHIQNQEHADAGTQMQMQKHTSRCRNSLRMWNSHEEAGTHTQGQELGADAGTRMQVQVQELGADPGTHMHMWNSHEEA